jgi:hypothetical protein
MINPLADRLAGRFAPIPAFVAVPAVLTTTAAAGTDAILVAGQAIVRVRIVLNVLSSDLIKDPAQYPNPFFNAGNPSTGPYLCQTAASYTYTFDFELTGTTTVDTAAALAAGIGITAAGLVVSPAGTPVPTLGSPTITGAVVYLGSPNTIAEEIVVVTPAFGTFALGSNNAFTLALPVFASPGFTAFATALVPAILGAAGLVTGVVPLVGVLADLLVSLLPGIIPGTTVITSITFGPGGLVIVTDAGTITVPFGAPLTSFLFALLGVDAATALLAALSFGFVVGLIQIYSPAHYVSFVHGDECQDYWIATNLELINV